MAGLVALLAALAFPSPLAGGWDGLPWETSLEMLALVSLLPLLVFLRPQLFGSRTLLALGVAVIALKAGLWLLQTPEGFRVDVFESREKYERNEPEKSWESIWSPAGTAIQRRSWVQAREFPLEWLNRYDVPHRRPDGIWEGEKMRQNARPWIRISGWVWARHGEAVILDLGPDLSSVSAQVFGQTRKLDRGTRVEVTAPNAESWSPMTISFQIESVFSEKTGFAPSIRFPDGREKPLLGLNRANISSERQPLPLWVWMGPWISRLVDGLTALCLFVPVLGIFRQLPRNILTLLVFLGVLAVGGPTLCGMFGMELTGRLTYGLFPAIACAFFARPLLAFLGPGRTLFWVLGLGAMPILALSWWGDMRGMSLFQVGDDWLAQQNLARAIFVGGDWLSFASEKIYVYQPGYRYFTGTLHVLFGQSAWPSRMLDAWAIVAVASMVPALCLWAGTGNRWALLAGCLAFAAYCSRPPFRLMGECIHEYVGAALVTAVAWLVVGRDRLAMRFLLLGITAMAAYLVRQNHIFVILACGLFFLPPLRGSWPEALNAFWMKIRGNLVGWFVLTVAVGVAVIGVCLRNWSSAGIFSINSPANLAANLGGVSSSFLTTLGLLIRADASEGWSSMGILIAAGFAAAFLVIFCRFGRFRELPMESALVLFAALVPYLTIRLIPCTERFSFIFVPWAAVCAVAALATLTKSLARNAA